MNVRRIVRRLTKKLIAIHILQKTSYRKDPCAILLFLHLSPAR